MATRLSKQRKANGRSLLTIGVIRAASTDAGNRSMRAGGREAWNEADADAATAEMSRLFEFAAA